MKAQERVLTLSGQEGLKCLYKHFKSQTCIFEPLLSLSPLRSGTEELHSLKDPAKISLF